MTEPADLATAIATEVAKQIPVKDAYDDAVKPGAQQVGGLIEDIAKTIRLVLAPLQITGALQDRFRDFLDTSIRRVPEEDRLAPPPQVLGPVLEGIRYEPSDSPITEMFSRLLSTSMNQRRVQDAHPAFSLIVKQLSSDEASLLNTMWNLWKDEQRSYRQHTYQALDRAANSFLDSVIELDETPDQHLTFPENIGFYIQHLQALGVAEMFYADQKPVYDTDEGHVGRIQVGIRHFMEFRLTDVGRKFMAAVSDH